MWSISVRRTPFLPVSLPPTMSIPTIPTISTISSTPRRWTARPSGTARPSSPVRRPVPARPSVPCCADRTSTMRPARRTPTLPICAPCGGITRCPSSSPSSVFPPGAAWRRSTGTPDAIRAICPSRSRGRRSWTAGATSPRQTARAAASLPGRTSGSSAPGTPCTR